MAEQVNLDLNLNNMIRFMSSDKKSSCSLGIYKGSISFSVFDQNSKSGPIIKARINDTAVEMLKMIINKVLENPEATPKTIEISPWNRDEKKLKYECSIQVGRTKEGVCFIRFMNDRNKDGVGFLTLADETVKLEGKDMANKESSELGMRVLLAHLITHVAIGSIITRDKMAQKGDGGQQSGGTGGGGNSDGDIPFS